MFYLGEFILLAYNFWIFRTTIYDVFLHYFPIEIFAIRYCWLWVMVWLIIRNKLFTAEQADHTLLWAYVLYLCTKVSILSHKEDPAPALSVWLSFYPGRKTTSLVLLLLFFLEHTNLSAQVDLFGHKEDPIAILSVCLSFLTFVFMYLYVVLLLRESFIHLFSIFLNKVGCYLVILYQRLIYFLLWWLLGE